MRLFVTALALCLGAPQAHAAWFVANFHAHAANDLVGDDGLESPADLHEVVAAHGFHFSLHTPHSTLAKDEDAAAAWSRQRLAESRLGTKRFTVAVGQELTVAPGSAYQEKVPLLGYSAPGNLNHLSIV